MLLLVTIKVSDYAQTPTTGRYLYIESYIRKLHIQIVNFEPKIFIYKRIFVRLCVCVFVNLIQVKCNIIKFIES